MTHRRTVGKHRRVSPNAGKVAVLGAVPVSIAVAFAATGTANATPANHAVVQAESVAPTPDVAAPVSVSEAVTPVESIDGPLAGPDMNNVNNGAINGALVGGAVGAAVGGLGGAATGAVVGGGTGLVVGSGAVLIPTVVAGVAGCLATGCLVDVPVLAAGIAGQFLVVPPATAIGGAVGAVAGGALGAAALGIPAAGVGAAIGAGAAAAGVPMPAPPIPAL